jgi:hypothetical protein
MAAGVLDYVWSIEEILGLLTINKEDQKEKEIHLIIQPNDNQFPPSPQRKRPQFSGMRSRLALFRMVLFYQAGRWLARRQTGLTTSPYHDPFIRFLD